MSELPSSASPGSTQSKGGPCVVCGKLSTDRCGDCAANGSKWFYFCSRDHQKLVWSTHKRVCGKRSSPFRWPGFSQSELDRILEISQHPIYTQAQEGKSLLDKMDEYIRLASGSKGPNDVEARKKALLSIFEKYKEQPGGNSIPSDRDSRKIVDYRNILYTTVGWSTVLNPTSSSPRAGPIALKDNVFNYSIGVQLDLVDGLPNDQQKSWWTPLQHRYLLYLTVLQKFMKDPSPGSYLVPFLSYTVKALRDHLVTEVSPTHPRVAQAFLPILMVPQLPSHLYA
ncbi:hypothetical protein JCM5350_000782 [Sporobolomyces pararoseus]